MNEKSNKYVVSSEEEVARLVTTEWIQEGVLQPVAFTLDEGESYLSVNRTAVESYDADVLSFVEPRDKYTKSHAGIFVRYQNRNIKRGKMINIGHASKEISTDTVLLEVRTQLLEMALLEECNIVV